MRPNPPRLPVPSVLLGLLLVTGTAWGDSERADSSASARLHLRVTVPEVLRVQDDEHPVSWVSDALGEGSAAQRLVVFSNLPRGVCVRLRLVDPGVRSWRLKPAQGAATEWSAPSPELRERCLLRAGTHVLELEHRFDGNQLAEGRWPVVTELHAW